MRVVKKAFAHAGAVIKGMLFIGFTIQILFGLSWMCCNFGQVQNFGESDSALYGGFFRLFGGIPQLLYLLQLAAAFLAGDFFLKSFSRERRFRNGRERFWGIWRALVLLTYPFAMQCHMAVLPFSFMGSLFLVMLSFLVRMPVWRSVFSRRGAVSEAGGRDTCACDKPAYMGSGGAGACNEAADIRGGDADACGKAAGGIRSLAEVRRRVIMNLALAVACAGLFALLSGVLEAAGREEPGHSIEAAVASRFAWPAIWNDQGSWTEDLREIVEDVLWETSYYPENMALLEFALEERVGAEAAAAYYRQIAEVAWRNHASMIIRQMGWDVLGYTVTPVVFQLQLRGEAYDSYTGRNYEIMRGNTPVMTRNYVNYGCWWFGAAFLLALLAAVTERISGEGRLLGAVVRPVVICFVCSGILVGLLTMRGAGLMDYKYTAVISQLWIIPAILFPGKKGKF